MSFTIASTNLNYKILLFTVFSIALYSKSKAQEQPSAITFKKQFIGPPNYIQGEKKMNFKELTVVLKPNAIAYNLILDAKKTRNWARGVEGAAIIVFSSFLIYTVNTAITSAANPPFVIIDNTGLILMISAIGLKAISRLVLKRSIVQTKNSIEVYNNGLPASAKLHEFRFGVTQHGVGLVLKF